VDKEIVIASPLISVELGRKGRKHCVAFASLSGAPGLTLGKLLDKAVLGVKMVYDVMMTSQVEKNAVFGLLAIGLTIVT